MCEESPHNSSVIISFRPKIVFALESRKSGTLFQFIPDYIVPNTSNLLTLLSLPFHWIAKLAPLFDNEHSLNSIDVVFQPKLKGRSTTLVSQLATIKHKKQPIILWISTNAGVELARTIANLQPIHFLIITETKELYEQVHNLHLDRDGPPPFMEIVCINQDNGDFNPYSNAQDIWLGYLRIFERFRSSRMEITGQSMWNSIRMEPDVFSVYSFGDLVRSAQDGLIHPSMSNIESIGVHDDYCVIANEILLNVVRHQFSWWRGGALKAGEAHEQSARLAKQILAWRSLSNLFSSVGTNIFRLAEGWNAEDFTIDTIARLSPYNHMAFSRLPREFTLKCLDLLKQNPSSVAFRETWDNILDNIPEEELNTIVPWQFILIGSSIPVWIDNDTIKYGPFRIADWLDPVIQIAPEYASHLLRQLGTTGRYKRLPQPHTSEEQRVADLFTSTISAESAFNSTVGLLYAKIFHCPVLKLESAGHQVYQPYQRITEFMEKLERHSDSKHPESRTERIKLHTAIVEEQAELSRNVTSLLEPTYLNLIKQKPIRLLHSFTDYPLEFVQLDGDYLGYTSHLSRTPLTPGTTPLINYQSTIDGLSLPTKAEEFLLVTPFEKTKPALTAVLESINLDGMIPDFQLAHVGRYRDLQNYLIDTSVKCLVYFGHGHYDASNDESCLRLSDHLFYARHVFELPRVPELIVLVGCNTSASSTILGNIGTAFLLNGAKQVVGTLFPVPTAIGSSFLTMFIRNLLSPGLQTETGIPRWFRDIAEILTSIRVRMRFLTVLHSLGEQGRASVDDIMALSNKYSSKMDEMSQDETWKDETHRDLIGEMLADIGYIDHANVSPFEWNVTEYPLFFTVLGCPWNTTSERWRSQ